MLAMNASENMEPFGYQSSGVSHSACIYHPENRTIDEVVVLGAGLASSAAESKMIQELIPRFVDKGIRVVTFDLYGHGESGGELETFDLDKGYASVADLLVAVRKRCFGPTEEELESDKILCIGNSLGAFLMMLAQQRVGREVIPQVT